MVRRTPEKGTTEKESESERTQIEWHIGDTKYDFSNEYANKCYW